MTRLIGGRSLASRRASAASPEFRGFDVVAESSRHRLEQAALDRIVIDNEYEGGHRHPEGGLAGRALRHTLTSR